MILILKIGNIIGNTTIRIKKAPALVRTSACIYLSLYYFLVRDNEYVAQAPELSYVCDSQSR